LSEVSVLDKEQHALAGPRWHRPAVRFGSPSERIFGHRKDEAGATALIKRDDAENRTWPAMEGGARFGFFC